MMKKIKEDGKYHLHDIWIKIMLLTYNTFRDLQVHAMNFYGKSLQYGCKYIHQSMPRMLTIWLDFASRITSRSGPYGNQEFDKLRRDALLKMTKIMGKYLLVKMKF